MPPELLEQRILESQQWGIQICQGMRAAILKLGYSQEQLPDIDFNQAKFSLLTDPLTQKQALKGIWYRNQQHKVGEIIFQVDDSFYAEYDVVMPHPKHKHWFVEAMTAWGREGNLKTDARLLEMQDA